MSAEELSRAYAEAAKRYSVLGECVTVFEALRRRISRNEANQSAKEGYERAFDEETERLEILRQMMREIRTEMDMDLLAIQRAKRLEGR